MTCGWAVELKFEVSSYGDQTQRIIGFKGAQLGVINFQFQIASQSANYFPALFSWQLSSSFIHFSDLPKHKCDRPCHEVIYDESISMAIAPSLKAAQNFEEQLGVNFSQLM